MGTTLPARVVVQERGYWRIRPDRGELEAAEQEKLKDYLGEIHLPYQIRDGRVCIPASISWATLDETLSHFYEGWAEVFPF
ncbi:MAG: hypothetical protein J0M24_25455 [Verrucomicrobia bacterium]|nr:hypothetical protein [Verrucomicrobiota bacterium]